MQPFLSPQRLLRSIKNKAPIHLRSALMVSRRYNATVMRYMTPRKAANIARLMIQRAAKTTKVAAAPAVLRVEVTNACNLRCPGCITGIKQNPNRRAAMSLNDFKNLIDDTYKDALLVRLDGMGEPLLNRALPEMIAYAHERGVGTAISANLNLAPKQKLRALIEAGLDHIVISCDGATQEVYETYRKTGDVERVFANLARLVALKRELGATNPFIEFQYILFDHNRHEEAAAKRRAEAIGVDRFFSFPSTIATFPDFEAWRARDMSRGVLVRRHDRDLESCFWLYLTHSVRAAGQVTTCCEGMSSAFGAGDVRDHALGKLRNDDTFRALRALYKTKAPLIRLDPVSAHKAQGIREALCTDCDRFPYIWKDLDELTDEQRSRVEVVNLGL